MKLTDNEREVLDTLWKALRRDLHRTFVAKEEVADLMLTCLLAGEHLLVVGPPGTAKSALLRGLVERTGARSFEYLLTRFTEPNELFGPVDMELYTQHKRYRRLTAGMLPDADVVFLDEIFKANSAILNALLTLLNERIFYNGDEGQAGVRRHHVRLLSVFAAANEVPDDPEYAALIDRFPVRLATDNVPESRTADMLRCAWDLERTRMSLERHGAAPAALVDPEAIRRLGMRVPEVEVAGVREPLLRFTSLARAEGLALSDRRVVRLLRLAAAAALLDGRAACELRDLWVLRHSWNQPAQAAAVHRLVRDVAGDIRAAVDPARPLRDLVRDLDDLAKLHEDAARSTDHARLAALHRLHVLQQELAHHPAPTGDKAPIEARLRQVVDRILEQMSHV
jgi:MoxR-like ATPase